MINKILVSQRLLDGVALPQPCHRLSHHGELGSHTGNSSQLGPPRIATINFTQFSELGMLKLFCCYALGPARHSAHHKQQDPWGVWECCPMYSGPCQGANSVLRRCFIRAGKYVQHLNH